MPRALLLLALLGCRAKATGERATVVPDDTGAQDDTDAQGEVSWRLSDSIGTLLYASWDQPRDATGRVEFQFDDEDWQSTPDRTFTAGPAEQLVLGVPYDTDVALRVVYDTGDPAQTSAVALAHTGPLPDGLPLPAVTISDAARYEPTARYLLGSINAAEGGWISGTFWMFIVDRQGRLVWARQGEEDYFTIYAQVSKDGDILFDVSTYWSRFSGGEDGHVNRMKIDGEITATYATPGMYHPFLELPDGSLVWAAGDANNVVLMRQSMGGVTESLWECDGFEPAIGQPGRCAINSIFYRKDADTLLLSFPMSQPFIVEMDATTAEPLRWFGDVSGGWGFDAPSSAFELPHGVTWTDVGTLLVSSQLSEDDQTGVVREYDVDDATQTLTQIWSFGADEGVEAHLGGAALRLPGGDTLHSFGTTPRVQEIAPEGLVVWDMAWSGERLLGRLTPLEDLYALAP